MAFSRDDIERVEEALGVELPIAYCELLVSLPAEFKGSMGSFFSLGLIADPELLIKINRIVQSGEWEDCDAEEYFVIGEDGCGNYYLIDPDDESTPIYFLEHDPPGFSESIGSIEELQSLLAKGQL